MKRAHYLLDNNRSVIVQEIAKSINSMNSIMENIIETKNNKKGERSKNKWLFQLFHELGVITTLYNQFIYLEEKEKEILESDDSNHIGFK